MEEMYLYYKFEVMRILNSKVIDLEMCISDGCLSLIVGLVLVEVIFLFFLGLYCIVNNFKGGMGDLIVVEVYINGFCILIDMKCFEEW